MASLGFTDATGAAVLTNGQAAPIDRFAEWTPTPEPAASRVFGLGTGAAHEWRFRTDCGASFALPMIPATSLDIVDRLILHLLGGGTVTVTTGDSASNVYTCRLFPETTPSVELSDRRVMEYTLRVKLKNTASAVMECLY